MKPEPGYGLPHGQDWGIVAKCPWCPAVNIKRNCKGQVTCGKMNCQKKQSDYRRYLREGRIPA